MSGTKLGGKAHVLGGAIRALRAQAGLSQRALAERLDLSHVSVVRWERGQRVPASSSVEAIADALSLPAVDRDHLVQLAREAADEPVNEVSAGQRGQADAMTALIKLELSATAITDVSTVLVPGLMQTADYARMALGDVPDVETKIAARLGRRDAITRERNPVQYTAYILEPILRQQIGQQVLVDQLKLIRKLADLPNVCVRIIPEAVGITRAHMGSFVLLEFDRADPIVHVEHLSTTAFLRDRDDLEEHQTALAGLDQTAMSPDNSIGLIADVIDKMETTQ